MDQTPTRPKLGRITMVKSQGVDTLAYLNELLKCTHVILTLYIPKHGEYPVNGLRYIEDGVIEVLCKDPASGRDFPYKVVWETHFNLYLGEA